MDHSEMGHVQPSKILGLEIPRESRIVSVGQG